jgi:hypothetical protein
MCEECFTAKAEHVDRPPRDELPCTPSEPCGRCDHCLDADVAVTSNGGGKSRPDLLVGLRTGAYLRERQFADLVYHLAGIVPEGSTLLVGPPKIGKSWLLLSLALGVASGGRVLGITVEARPVLYLALEDSDRRLQTRCTKLLGDKAAIPADLSYMTRIEPGEVLATVGQWLSMHDATTPLVILDTLGKVMPPALIGESNYQRDYRVASALKHLVDDRQGAALVIAHHDRKANADDFVDAVSGTHGLAGAADTIVVLARARQENSGLLKVTGRDVEEAEYAVTLKGGCAWELAGHSLQAAVTQAAKVRATKGVGDRMAEIIGFVTAHPAGVSPAQVGNALSLDRRAAAAYLGRAVESNRLGRLGRGLYGPSTPVVIVDSVDSDATGMGEVNADNTYNTPTGEALRLLRAGFGDDIEERDDWSLNPPRSRHDDQGPPGRGQHGDGGDQDHHHQR